MKEVKPRPTRCFVNRDDGFKVTIFPSSLTQLPLVYLVVKEWGVDWEPEVSEQTAEQIWVNYGIKLDEK